MKHTKIPEKLTLPMPFNAFVYPNAGTARGTRISGNGVVTLRFEPMGENEPLAVRFEDLDVTLHPCRIPFDLDGDGVLECLDIPAARFGAEMFDLAASHGRFDPETRALDLTVVVVLSARALGGITGEEVRFEIVEHGTLDLDSVRFDTRAAPFAITSGPLKGMTFVNCTGTVGNVPCYAALAFGVVVANGSFPAGATAGQAPGKVWIAPNTPVRLLWEATGASQVEIRPEIGRKPLVGSQMLPDVLAQLRPVTRDAVYHAATIGGECIEAEQLVEIAVCVDGQELAQTAPYNDPLGIWNAQLPAHTYDPNILIKEVMIDTHHGDAVQFLHWRLDHIPPGTGLPTGTVIAAPNQWTSVAAAHVLPGEYRFTPQLEGAAYPEKDRNRKIYFRLKVSLP